MFDAKGFEDVAVGLLCDWSVLGEGVVLVECRDRRIDGAGDGSVGANLDFCLRQTVERRGVSSHKLRTVGKTGQGRSIKPGTPEIVKRLIRSSCERRSRISI
jgi:hypothetical protein